MANGIVAEIFWKLGLHSGALHAGLEQAKLKVRETAGEIKSKLRKETGEARDALDLLGNQFGLHLPREMKKFIAESSLIRPALAAAFNIGIAGGFLLILDQVAKKIIQVTNEMAGLTKATREWGQEAVDASIKALSQGQLRRLIEDLEKNQQGMTFLGRVLAFGLDPTRALTAPSKEETDTTLMKLRGRFLELSQGVTKDNQKAAKDSEEAWRAFFAEKLPAHFKKVADAAKKEADRARENWIKFTGAGLPPPDVRPTLLRRGEMDLRTLRENFNNVIPNLRGPAGAFAADLARMAEAGLEVWRRTRTEGEQLKLHLEDLNKLWKAGVIDVETYGRAVKQALGQSIDLVGDLKRGFIGVAEGGLSRLGDQILGVGTTWREFARQILVDLGRMIFYLLVVKPLIGALSGALFGGGGGGGGGIPAGIGTPPTFPPMGGGPGFQHGGFLPPGKWGVAGEAGPEPIFGGRTGLTVVPHPGARNGPQVVIHQDNRGADFGSVHKIAQANSLLTVQSFARLLRDQQSRVA